MSLPGGRFLENQEPKKRLYHIPLTPSRAVAEGPAGIFVVVVWSCFFALFCFCFFMSRVLPVELRLASSPRE